VEVVDVLRKRKVNVCCKMERGGCEDNRGAEYKIYWKGGKESTAGVPVLIK
jgi:hypothetical protein